MLEVPAGLQIYEANPGTVEGSPHLLGVGADAPRGGSQVALVLHVGVVRNNRPGTGRADYGLSIRELDTWVGPEVHEKAMGMLRVIPIPWVGDEVRGQAGDTRVGFAGCLALEDLRYAAATNNRV